MSSVVPVCPLDDLAQMSDVFAREGCVRIPNVFTPGEVAALRAATDKCAADETLSGKYRTAVANAFVLRYCHELDPIFAETLKKENVIQIAESVLGKGARFNAFNVIRNGTGQAISYWHIDDVVEFPLPPEIARFDARIRMPVFWMTIQVALSDIDSLENGPTQYIPGSHYSGRTPTPPDDPRWEGQGAVPALCKAGDVYLTNHQCWHRGAPNTSDRTRYVMQLQYAARWADIRFKGQG
jgi:ectoine hydroxylase-related dioxygenase (phytanoyl-CoA dioxygenase family)